jgi:hypothetical protein
MTDKMTRKKMRKVNRAAKARQNTHRENREMFVGLLTSKVD